MSNRLSTIGLSGAAVALVCSFTPVLPVILPAMGLSSLLPVIYRDAVLLPVVIAFLALAAIGLWKKPAK